MKPCYLQEAWIAHIKWLARRVRFWRNLAGEKKHPFPWLSVYQLERYREAMVILKKAIAMMKEIK